MLVRLLAFFLVATGGPTMLLYLYVLAAVIMRLLPHPWNMTPVGAMFRFSGATFRRKWDSLLIPLAALLVSDYAVIHVLYAGRYGWFSPYSWAGFLLVGIIGWALRDRITYATVATGSLAGSVVFFVISNFGVWAAGQLYPHTWTGLATCYLAGLPFFRNTAIGDMIYAGLMFGSYVLIRYRRPAEIRTA
jgi:hypothetical protein